MGQDVNLARKIAVENVGYVFAYFCGGHKNNFNDFVASENPRGRIRLIVKRNVKTKRWERFV